MADLVSFGTLLAEMEGKIADKKSHGTTKR